jgi:Alanine-zipper, major outer membrane lipoprotein
MKEVVGRGRTADPIETPTRRNFMSKTRTIAAGLSVAAALLMLSACQTSNEYSELDRRVTDLESRADAASTRATEMESAANQCTATCQEVQVRANRMMQQSQMK